MEISCGKENALTTAVVISTYNGSRYILQQLESIYNQSIRPTKVYIFDDQSSDSTAEIVGCFIKDKGLESSWSITINDERKGWRRNFMEGFSNVEEEIILPCDQDDIWPLDKVEKCQQLMMRNDFISVIIGKSLPFYDEHYVPETVNENIDYSCDSFGLKEFSHSAPGCAICFRNSFFRQVSHYWTVEQPHDAFILHMGRLMDGCYRTNAVTVFHREHRTNTMKIEAEGLSYCEYNQKANEQRRAAVDCMKFFLSENQQYAADSKRDAIEIIEKWLIARSNLLSNRTIISAIGVIKFHSCYRSYKSCFGDILRALLNKSNL